MNPDHFVTPYAKITSTRMKDLNVRQEAIKILEERVSKDLFDLSCSNFLLDMSLKSRERKQKSYWDLIKIKSFCMVKETVSKTESNQWNGRKYLQMTYQIKG